MTHYAIDAERGVLLAAWETGAGELATTVSDVPANDDPTDALRLAAALSVLSKVLWRCYTHPASAAAADVAPNSDGWRREQSRNAFAEVVSAVSRPEVPDERGLLLTSYDPVEESANAVGRALHQIDSPALTAKVADDVRAEVAAVEDAERGELSGRARQAVVLSREDASPVQVAAANDILDDRPLTTDDELFTTLDPTAAAVAAAHWLYAAATVTADQAAIDVTDVVLEADNIEALPVKTPTLVLELLDSGTTPREAVTGLVSEALAVAEGHAPDADALSARIASAHDLALAHAADDPELRTELMRLRLTTLDPARPAPDLLEDLLIGINGCYLLYQEYLDDDAGDTDGEDDTDDDFEERAYTDFAAAVRTEARGHQARLN